MKYRFVVLTIIGLFWSSPSFGEPTRPFQVEAGVGATFGDENRTLSFQAFAGYFQSLGALSEKWGLFTSVGAQLEVGGLFIYRPEFDNTISVSRYGVGPMARFGFAYGEDDWSDIYTYLGAGLVWSSADYVGSVEVPEADGVWGSRLVLGVSWPGSWAAVAEDMGKGNCDGGTCGIEMFRFLLPNSLEATMDGWGGDTSMPVRWGFALKWSL